MAMGYRLSFHIRDILNIITDSGRPTVANDVLDLLNNLFKHVIQLNITLNNPASAFSYKDAGGHEPSRERALSIFRQSPVATTIWHAFVGGFRGT